MTLQNLLKIGRLKPHTPTAQEIQRLLAAADRNIADAQTVIISDETRFDAAYKAIMQLALGIPNADWVVLDALRRKRNVNDYEGAPIEPAAVAECIAQAKAMRTRIQSWLAEHHPQYLA